MSVAPLTAVPLVAAAAAAAPAVDAPAASRPGLGGLVDALRRIMAEPPTMPSVEARVAAILRAIDWSAPRIVIYVRGTSERDVRPEIRAAFQAELPGVPLHQVEYQASWRFDESVPDGAAVLRGVLEGIARRRRPGQQVLLAGESQGAWVISAVLAHPALARHVTRTVLWGAPAAAPMDFADGHDPRVREYNNAGDVVTMDFGMRANTMLTGAITRFARRDVLGGVLPILGYAVTNPAALGALLAAQAWRVPLLGKLMPSPHGYDFRDGVRFLRSGAARVSAGFEGPRTSAAGAAAVAATAPVPAPAPRRRRTARTR